MTSYHLLYIPMVLFIGAVIGFTLGKRAAAGEAEQEVRKARRKAMREEAFRKNDGE